MDYDENLEHINLETSYLSNKEWNNIPKGNFEAFQPVEIQQRPKIEKTNKLDENDTPDNYRNVHLTKYTYDFIESVGLQGLKYVFMRNTTWVRRLIWLSLLLAASAYCVYVTITNINNYYSYPTITSTKTYYVSKLEFPTVTICDYNVFQKSLVSQEQYNMLADMYMPYEFFYNETGKDPTRYDHVDIAELMVNASFPYDLTYCTYHSLPCNHSHTYKKLRDVGTCITFDPSQDSFAKYQYLPGRQAGLNMGLAKFGEQWTPGPFMNSEGFIALVHEPGEEAVLVENFGTNVPMGSIVNLIISRTDVTLLPPPHGQCGTRTLQYYDKYTQAACQQECELRLYLTYCGCKMPYMRADNTTKSCNNIKLRACGAAFYANFSDAVKQVCDCPPECHKTKYEVKATNAKYTNDTRNIIMSALGDFDVWEGAVEIRVYFAKMMYKTQIQEVAYSIEKLLCDFGGAAGLFLGASFMSVVEVLDFLCYIGWFGSIKLWKKQKKERTVKPSNT